MVVTRLCNLVTTLQPPAQNMGGARMQQCPRAARYRSASRKGVVCGLWLILEGNRQAVKCCRHGCGTGRGWWMGNDSNMVAGIAELAEGSEGSSDPEIFGKQSKMRMHVSQL